MKKIILLLALFAGFMAAAQCPGDRVEFFKDKKMKVLPLSQNLQRSGFKGFYTDADLTAVFKKTGKTSDYNALVGKEFKVVSYEPFYDQNVQRYKLLLDNPETGKLYYDYDPDDCSFFPFDLKLPQLDPCDAITVDRAFAGIASYSSKKVEGLGFTRFFNDDGINNTVTVVTSLPVGDLKGMSIVLSNNVTIENKEAKIGDVSNGRGEQFFSMLFLTEEETELVKKYEIIKVKIGNEEKTVKKGALLKSYFNCLLNKELPADYVLAKCEDITTDTNAVPGEIHYLTGVINGVSLRKVVAKNVTTYICSVAVLSNTMQIGTGVMIRFEGDTLINYPDAKAIEEKYEDGTYAYLAAFIIKPEDLGHFTKLRIKGVKVIDAVRPIRIGTQVRKIINCLVEK